VKPLDQCRLYAFVDTAYLHGRRPEAVAAELCAGGADLIQLRAKQSSPEEVRRMMDAILPVTRQAGIGLVLNDDVVMADLAGVELCHLGQEDFFDAGYTRIDQLPISHRSLKVGLSTHAPAQAERAVAAGAHYLGVGPVYATGTKPTARPVTLAYVRWAAAHVQIPWFAIGGITLQNLDEVLAAGARRICVVSAILNAPDIAAACRQFKDRISCV
jgi:thiamine-phosphate pyrophosphorylase